MADVDEDPPADLVDAVRAAHEAGARVVSLCTGAFVLAAAGLLDGLRATTHWAHTDELAARYPRVEVDPDVLYVDNGSVLTSAGKAAAMDLCLHLVRLRPRLGDRQRGRPPPGRAAAPGRRPGPVRHHPGARPGRPSPGRPAPLGDANGWTGR